MKILHTADWHLGARLRRQSRAGDLQRAVEQVLSYCDEEAVDVLLIAGDLFDTICRPDDVRAAVAHFKDAVKPFLARGGSVLCMTGNHDNETFCATLQHALELADPAPASIGRLWSPGRFHLATRPTFCRLADRSGGEVQFVLMPYPTASRYLDDAVTSYDSAEAKHRRLIESFSGTIARIREHRDFDRALPTVLACHLFTRGVRLPNGYEVTERDDVVCPEADLEIGWAYVALGHVHRAQTIGGRSHVRYSGSIERLDLDERADDKGVVLVDVGPEGLRGSPVVLPLDATPFLDLALEDSWEELLRLERQYEESGRNILVRCHFQFTPGEDDPDAISRRVRALFPRTYELRAVDRRASAEPNPVDEDQFGTVIGFRDVVRTYLQTRLSNDPLAESVLAAADRLLAAEGD